MTMLSRSVQLKHVKVKTKSPPLCLTIRKLSTETSVCSFQLLELRKNTATSVAYQSKFTHHLKIHKKIHMDVAQVPKTLKRTEENAEERTNEQREL